MAYSQTWRGRASKARSRKQQKLRPHSKKNRKARRDAAKAIIDDAKKEGCWICGETFGPALDFHHVRPESKKGKRDVPSKASSPNRARKYLSECALVCATCHRKIHNGFDFGWTHANDVPEFGIQRGDKMSIHMWLLGQLGLRAADLEPYKNQLELKLVSSDE